MVDIDPTGCSAKDAITRLVEAIRRRNGPRSEYQERHGTKHLFGEVQVLKPSPALVCRAVRAGLLHLTLLRCTPERHSIIITSILSRWHTLEEPQNQVLTAGRCMLRSRCTMDATVAFSAHHYIESIIGL